MVFPEHEETERHILHLNSGSLQKLFPSLCLFQSISSTHTKCYLAVDNLLVFGVQFEV
jgi:hypothetical protein